MADNPKLPKCGVDAEGADAYAAVLTAPAYTCQNLYACASTHGAVISLDGGTTDHLYVPAGGSVTLNKLNIPAAASIMAKNAVAGSNYVNCSVSVWSD